MGVGTSLLQLEMVQAAGFKRIVNTDYSQVCVGGYDRQLRGTEERETAQAATVGWCRWQTIFIPLTQRLTR